MHVVLVTPGATDTVSGGYGYNREMMAALAAHGHRVEIVAPRDLEHVPDAARIVVDGIGISAFAEHPDLLASRRAIGLIHHPTALESGRDDHARAGLRVLEAQIYATLPRLVVTSEATLERLVAEFAVPRERIVVVTPGTRNASRSTGSPGARCEVLAVGALVPRKGHDVLIRAVSPLTDLDWALTIVGTSSRDPSHAEALRTLADTLGVGSRVTLAGEVTDAELEGSWKRADVFALASNFEAYGMAVAEALRRGLPAAVSSGGAAASLVTPEAGAVCAPGDVQTLSKSLRRMIVDLPLRRDMAEHAWQIGRTLPDWTSQARAFAAAIAT
ncbi:MAG: glycosyltransferase family 4 protein [Acidisphaera sp.]|nr:glycosyltransferase family 4 protein [Acidisphaera sp.]